MILFYFSVRVGHFIHIATVYGSPVSALNMFTLNNNSISTINSTLAKPKKKHSILKGVNPIQTFSFY